MGNDPRLQQSGQWEGHVKMSKRGVEPLRTAFFQAAFSASQHDPELKAFYLRKRAAGKKHEVALSHLMRILTGDSSPCSAPNNPIDLRKCSSKMQPNYLQPLTTSHSLSASPS